MITVNISIGEEYNGVRVYCEGELKELVARMLIYILYEQFQIDLEKHWDYTHWFYFRDYTRDEHIGKKLIQAYIETKNNLPSSYHLTKENCNEA